jgi:hypothetical protein
MRRTQAVVSALLRQEVNMSIVKRDNWTEGDVDALPNGEHDYFERKSGQLFQNRGDLLAALAKATSAFANSGGGHIVLGVDDQGVPDGVPHRQGNTSTRDWLEQQIPNLVAYPLADFRAHVVQRSSPSRIPPGMDVVVVDVGDSALAPHQCLRSGSGISRLTYYYRQAGRSEPAPHFYLELLRQRLVSPVLEVKDFSLEIVGFSHQDGATFLATRLHFPIENVGRVAAYRWKLLLTNIHWAGDDGRDGDFRIGRNQFPPGILSSSIGVRRDDTILPGTRLQEDTDFGVFIRPAERTPLAVSNEINRMVTSVRLSYRIATETSPGEVCELAPQNFVNVQDLVLRYLQVANWRRCNKRFDRLFTPQSSRALLQARAPRRRRQV